MPHDKKPIARQRPRGVPYIDVEANGFWYVYWSDGRRSKRQSLGTQSQNDATARFAEWIRQDVKAKDAGKGDVDYTVAELWPIYDEKHVQTTAVMPEGKKTIGYAWANLRPVFGPLLVAEVDQAAVDRYVVTRRAAGAAPATVRREIATLLAGLRFCASKKGGKLCSAVDLDDIELPPDSKPRDKWLSIAEVQRLLDAAAETRNGRPYIGTIKNMAGELCYFAYWREGGRNKTESLHTQSREEAEVRFAEWRARRSETARLSRIERFIWLALFTTSRKQALLELTWDRVDFSTNTIHLNVPGRRLTKKRRADVSIATQLRPVLERAYAERVSDLVLDHGADDIWAGLQYVAIRAGFSDQKVLRGASPKATGISPHVFRHSGATHMARGNVSLWKVARTLGDSISTTEKVYAKWAPEHPSETVDVISGGALEAAE
jgi:integrase